MSLALVGYTGFVGANIANSHAFDGLYNSKNIEAAFGTKPDLLIYAGLPAAKYLANTAPEKDAEVCKNAFENIKKIAPKRLVLISTVDVYETPTGDENTPASQNNPAAYGRNRAMLEELVRDEYGDALIIRLPGLFGAGLKKNFIYDFLHPAPAMLKAEKYAELCEKSALVRQSYTPAQNGFYALTQPSSALTEFFAQNDFNALCFTDCRAKYQFYDLSNLWRDISVALAANITLLNIATQPLCTADIYAALTHGGTFTNTLSQAPVSYDMHSKYDALYGGQNGYLYSADEIMQALCGFVFAAQREAK